MRNLTFILLILLSFDVYSQKLSLQKSNDNNIEVADTSSFKVISNDNNIEITIDIRKKISFNRKDIDYIWEPEPGLKILIYRKDD